MAQVNRNAKAFTIVELLISLLISSIVFSAGYLALQLVRKKFSTVNLKYKEVAAINSVSYLMNKDFQESRQIKGNLQNGISIICNKDSAIVTYNIADTLIVRRQNTLTDSFPIMLKEPELNFEGKRLPGGTDVCIDQVSFKVEANNETIEIIVAKKYSAFELMAIEGTCSNTKQENAGI